MRHWLLGTLAAVLLLVSGGAWACPICFTGQTVTLGQRLAAADRVVLAMPDAGGTRFRIVDVIKGDDTRGAVIEQEVTGLAGLPTRPEKPLVLIHEGRAGPWSSIGAIGAGYAAWLRQLATIDAAGGGQSVFGRLRVAQAAAGLSEQLALVLPYLEDPEPLAAEIAYGEVRRVPYAAMRALKPRLDAQRIARWIDDPGVAERRSGYLLLLGIAGGADDAARLEQRIAAAWQARSDADLAAMLAADLELRGPARVGWIEQAYLVDGNRTLPEIKAALLALAEHGDTDAVVPRARVVEAYRLFMRVNPANAGLVALKLTFWQQWDATAEFVALLDSNSVADPAQQLAIVTFLSHSPDEAARAALHRHAARSR
jgi:hypothetical protein